MNSETILIFLAVLPIFLLLVFVYTKDHTREPIKLLSGLFVLGILSCALVLLITMVISYLFPFLGANLLDEGFLGVFIYSFFRVALLEELCKWIMLYFGGYKNKEFDETFDIIVYSVFVSLGFAFLENIVFILFSGNIESLILRAIISVPGHACFGIFMGYYLSIARQYNKKKDRNKKIENIILSIIIPVSVHGLFDFCLMGKLKILLVVFWMFIVFVYILSIYRLKVAREDNKKICNKCGGIIKGKICHSCGERQE